MQAWSARPVPPLAGPAVPRPVQAFDTGRQRLVPVGPASGRARMYVCGITPYDATHIGHANTYVAFDLLHRIWRDAGLEVDYVQNVTDVDDPLLVRARETGVDWQALAEQQTQLYREDMAALNVLPPTALVGAVEAIPRITELIENLLDRGAVYAVDDPQFPDLYFAQDSDPGFGSLAKLPEAEALALFGERGGDPERPGKKGPLDCLVWRLAREDEPSWPSSFGAGRPGWHIECTAIALDLLGPNFDVQGGGSDLVFPHHEMSAGARAGGHGAGVRVGVPAQRHGRAGRREDVQVPRQSGLRVPAPPVRRRPNGDPAGPAGAPLPGRLGVERRGADGGPRTG